MQRGGCTFKRSAALFCVVLAWAPAGFAFAAASPAGAWRQHGREAFLEFLLYAGCGEPCASLLADPAGYGPGSLQLSSAAFGCADVDTLLPSLQFLYESSKRMRDGMVPGIFVDGGANIGRATARWMASMGDIFGRGVAANETQLPGLICAGSSAVAGGGAASAASCLPALVVVALEPLQANFDLLQKHARELGWYREGFIAVNAALGDQVGEAEMAYSADFAVDEVATLHFDADDQRQRCMVKTLTLGSALDLALDQFEGSARREDGIFLLKLDIEGSEPAVLRSMLLSGLPVKFVSMEFSTGTWREPLGKVVAELFDGGFFCFIITAQRLFPVSGPFWDPVYELPVWSNLVCGQEDDIDLESLVQLHSGAVGLWPRMPGFYLEGYADDDGAVYGFRAAQQRCVDLEGKCAGVTCECPGGGCGSSASAAELGPCTVRAGRGGAKQSPSDEVTYLSDPANGELFLMYRRAVADTADAEARGARAAQPR